jgi:hypothetical protein
MIAPQVRQTAGLRGPLKIIENPAILRHKAVPKLRFWNSFLEFSGKLGRGPVFQGLVHKPTGFWNRLAYKTCGGVSKRSYY